jgi:DNA-binding response OmpR family regulator
MTPLKILMADDEEDVLEIMAKKISQEGYLVIKAKDGEEAWEKIKSESPDIILLDLTMPKKDGFQVLKELREHPPTTKWIPVIIISARHELEDVQKGFSMEADHYISKPCTVADILKGVKLMMQLIPQHKSHLEIQGEKDR